MVLVPAGLSRLCPGSSFGLRQKVVVPALSRPGPQVLPKFLKLRPSMVERLYSTMFPMWSCQSGHKWAIFFPKLRGRLREGYAMAMRQWNSARGYARATRAAEVGYAVPARCYKRLRVSQVRRFCERKWAFALCVYIYRLLWYDYDMNEKHSSNTHVCFTSQIIYCINGPVSRIMAPPIVWVTEDPDARGRGTAIPSAIPSIAICYRILPIFYIHNNLYVYIYSL